MCTLLILRQDEKLVAVMNRDDDKARIEENVREFEGGVLAPIDVRSGGSWTAINSDRVAGFLLNRYDKCEIKSKRSRGEIVLNVLANGGFEECVSFVKSADLSCYMPFVLVLLNSEQLVKFDWNGQKLSENKIELGDYYVLTSSSIEEEVVKKYRYDRFDEWYGGDRDFVNELPKFNVTQIKDRQDYSVMVEREKVQTLSIVKVCLDKEEVDMQYLPRSEIEKLIISQ